MVAGQITGIGSESLSTFMGPDINPSVALSWRGREGDLRAIRQGQGSHYLLTGVARGQRFTNWSGHFGAHWLTASFDRHEVCGASKVLGRLSSHLGELPKEPWAADQARPQGCLLERLLLVSFSNGSLI